MTDARSDRAELVEELRSRARDLYRRSDNVPLGRGASQAAIDRVGDLREEADQLIARAPRLETGEAE